MEVKKERLVSLDVMRGLTVACMILVNNGAGPDTFAQLQHSKWHGLTFCDLVFPFFLFMVGVSIYISFNKIKFAYSPDVVKKIVKRTVMLFAIGLLLHMWDMATKGNWNLVSDLRIWGVLQRIALCYGIVSFMSLRLSWKSMLIVAVCLLVGYAFLLPFFHGYDLSDENIIAVVDRAVFGEAHLYRKSPIDPEGLLSTIPSIGHTIIGFSFGHILMSDKPLKDKLKDIRMEWMSFAFISVGLIAEIPLNKRVWSTSYVILTCTLAMLVMYVLLIIIDKWGKKGWCKIFQAFGMNAFFIYVVSEVLAPALSHWGLKMPIYEAIHSVVSNTYWASLTYALLFVLVMALIAWVLWKKKIVIKI